MHSEYNVANYAEILGGHEQENPKFGEIIKK
jgi:hypothetical protein